MTGRKWTPRIVGGTDYGDGLDNSPSEDVLIANPITDTDQFHFTKDHAVHITAENLSRHASMIPAEKNPSWEYGPQVNVRDGAMLRTGQYVTEFHNGIAIQLYWVEG